MSAVSARPMRCIVRGGVGNGGRLRIAAVLLCLALAAPGLLPAQARPDSIPARADTARDSLAARLERAEAAIALLRQQLAIEAGTSVRTRSRVQVELSARILSNGFSTAGRVNNVDVPQFALSEAVAQTNFGTPGTRVLGMSVRQTRIGAAISVDSVFGGRFEGDVDLDFFGGATTAPGDRRLYPEPRLRTARAHLMWDRTSILVGSETPLISDLNPVSLATVAVPGFVTVGNLWNWLPQIRVSHDVFTHASGVRVGVQGAVISPLAGAQHAAETDGADAAERSGRPFVEGRLHVRWGAEDVRTGPPPDAALGEPGGEIGIGVHRGWVRLIGDTASASRAVSADLRVMPVRGVELRGEAYRGVLIRGLGGGGIAQVVGQPAPGVSIGVPLHDTAGWLQLNVQAATTLIAGAGCGRSVIDAADRPVRSRNTTCSTHLLWRPAQPIVVGLEYRRTTTVYGGPSFRAHHINLSFGIEL